MLAGVTACVEFDDDADFEALADQSDDPSESAVGLADELASDNGATPYAGFPVVECRTHNVIGVLDDVRGASCSLPGTPISPDWQWHTMFEDFTPDLAHWTEALPLGLKRFCIYEYVGAGEPSPEAYTSLFSSLDNYPHMSIDSVAPDCRGQVVQGGGLNVPAVQAELAQAMHSATQWIDGQRLASTSANRLFAEVAILDTVSQEAFANPAIDPVNEHGLLMGDIVGDIACPDGNSDCTDAIRYHVAMPRFDDEAADHSTGGDHGTMGDLAMAIAAAVGQWRENRLNDPHAPQRLILSASLGWVPESQVTADPNRGPVQAIEEALVFAACNGAIVLAAAGNTTDAACGPNEVDPLAPATYELVAAPTEAECALRGYSQIDPFGFPVFKDPRPLAWAVGGLDGKDRAISNARQKAMPSLAAYASQATVETGAGYTTALTGTSVSTAVVAATASMVWSYLPELTPEQVMAAIYESGVDVGLDADFEFTQTGQPVHRASVCMALEYACNQYANPGHCPELECGDPTPPADGHLEGYFAAADDALADPSNVVDTYDGEDGIVPVCQAPSWDEQIDPQPEHPMCPECMLDSPEVPDVEPDNDALSMTVGSAYKGQITAINLVTYDANGTSMTFVMSQKVINSVNDPFTDLTVVNLDAPGTVAATLSFTAGDSIQDGPIIVRNP